MAPPEIIEFTPDTTSVVVDRMAAIVEAGRGWINLQPAIEDEDVPRAAASQGLFRVFSGRGPVVPLCTWLPGERNRRGIEYVSLGIQHGSGPKAAERLREAGTPVPDGWHVFSDHGKRGLVVAAPPSAPNAEVLAWLLRAGAALNMAHPTGDWRAVVYKS